MNNRELYQISALICFILAGSASTVLAAPPTPEQKLKQIENYCFDSKRASVDARTCLQGRLDHANAEIASAVRKRLLEIDEVARKPKEVLQLSGADASREWSAAFKAEQEAWERYRQQRCQNVQNFENYPGNGAWLTQCSLRLALERLREIEDGY